MNRFDRSNHQTSDPNFFQPNVVGCDEKTDADLQRHRNNNHIHSPNIGCNGSNNLLFPTELHKACASQASTVSQLRAHLLARPNASSIRDKKGRLPLHLLAQRLLSMSVSAPPQNVALQRDTVLTEDMELFVMELYRAYPHSIVTCETSTNAGGVRGRGSNPEGLGSCMQIGSAGNTSPWTQADRGNVPAKIPFADIFYRWIETCHTQNGFFASKSYQALDPVAYFDSSSFMVGAEDATVADDRTFDTRSTLTMPTVFHSVSSVSLASAKTRSFNKGMNPLNQSVCERSVKPYSNGASLAGRSMKSRKSRMGNTSTGGAAGTGSINDFDPEQPGGSVREEQRKDGSGQTVMTEFASYDGDIKTLHQYEEMFPTTGMVFVPPVVEFSFRVLSRVFQEVQDTCQTLRYSKQGTAAGFSSTKLDDVKTSQDAGSTDEEESMHNIGYLLVASLASVPSLVKTLLLIHDHDPVKQRLFEFSLVQHVMRSPSGAGDWIVYMLECVDGSVTRKAVDYLEMLSEPVEAEDIAADKTSTVNKMTQRHTIYRKVAMLDYFLHATLALDDVDEVERAAATEIVQKAVEMHLDQPWHTSMALVDGLIHVVIVTAFAVCGNMFMNSSAYARGTYLPLTFLLLTGELYFLLRIPCELRAMYKISPATFWKNCFGFRTVVDMLATGVSLGCTIALDLHLIEGVVPSGISNSFRAMLAIASGLLWLKLLLFLKKVNTGVAKVMFIVEKVATDLRGLIFVFLLATLAFGQMFFFLLGDENCSFDQGNSGLFETAACTPLRLYYLRAMALSYGSSDLQEYNNAFFGLVFATFTISMVIILFNTCIAVAVDSHSRWVELSNKSGGRGRLAYLADLFAVHNILGGEWTLLQYCAAALFSSSVVVLFILSIDCIRRDMEDQYGINVLIAIVVVILILLLTSVVAFLAHINFQTAPGRIDARPSCFSKLCSYRIVSLVASPAKLCVRKMISLDDERREESDKPKWNGSWAELRTNLGNLGHTNTTALKGDINNLFSSMERYQHHNEDRNRSDVLTAMRASEGRIEALIENLHQVLSSQKG